MKSFTAAFQTIYFEAATRRESDNCAVGETVLVNLNLSEDKLRSNEPASKMA